MEKKITSYKVSKKYDVNQATVSQRCRNGTIPAEKVEKDGRLVWLILEEDIQKIYKLRKKRKIIKKTR